MSPAANVADDREPGSGPDSGPDSAPESVLRTLTVAIAVALLCSALVSGAVYVLRPIQDAYGLLARNRTIVEAAYGAAERSDAAVIQAFLGLDARVLDLDTGTYVAGFDAHAFDAWPGVAAAPGNDAQAARGEGAATAREGDGSGARRVPVYFVTGDDAAAHLVVPVAGPGMWSTLQGYVGLRADLNSIAGVAVYRHGETPGIGDRIESAAWLGAWRDRRLYDASGATRIRVARGEGAEDPHRVDVVSGATITSSAFGRLVNACFGDDGYGPWLARLRRQRTGEGGAP
ncbi:MAG TPA: FMN-binding protein [Pseudomonadales bacterium]|nr:FMN-binding protein [Pseudomonadales bacterium]